MKHHSSLATPKRKTRAGLKSLSLNGGDLLAEPDQLDPQFAELVGNGRFKKVSASFYLPDSPNNPKPGTLYLRHVGFLLAQPPSHWGQLTLFGEKEEGVGVCRLE